MGMNAAGLGNERKPPMSPHRFAPILLILASVAGTVPAYSAELTVKLESPTTNDKVVYSDVWPGMSTHISNFETEPAVTAEQVQARHAEILAKQAEQEQVLAEREEAYNAAAPIRAAYDELR